MPCVVMLVNGIFTDFYGRVTQPFMKPLMNLTDLAEYLGITRPTAYVVIAREGFPKPVTLGNRRVWNREDVDAWRLIQPATGPAASL